MVDDVDIAAAKEDVVGRVAAVIEKVYCRKRKAVCQIESFSPKQDKYLAAWKAAAMICITHRFNPVEFVEVQFHACKPYPYITDICSPKAVNRFMDNRKVYAAEVGLEFNLQVSVVERRLELGDTITDILQDPKEAFDPLFICAMANLYGLYGVSEKLYGAAMAKYLSSIYYEQIYSKMLPEKFVELARTFSEDAKCP